MDCLDSGVHVCKLASLIHQRGLQAHREDPTLPGVSKPMIVHLKYQAIHLESSAICSKEHGSHVKEVFTEHARRMLIAVLGSKEVNMYFFAFCI